MSYSEWKDGYALETTFKDGTTIDGAGDTAYLIGALSPKSEMPSPTYDVEYPATGVNAKEVGAGLPVKGRAEQRGMLGFAVQNGICCYLGMGKSSTAASIHTITPTTDGSLLPSFAWQHEEKGTATNEEYQFQGCKVDSLVLSHDAKNPEINFLLARMEIMAAYALDPGFALTNDPALPATANAAAYSALTRTWDLGGTGTSIDGLQKIEIAIINGLVPQYAHSYDTGVYTGRWAYAFAEANMKVYNIDMLMSKNTIEREIWDELITGTNIKEAYFKWTRSANDYIEVTATDCAVTMSELNTPADMKDIVRVTLVPRALSIAVKDSIAGGFYGE